MNILSVVFTVLQVTSLVEVCTSVRDGRKIKSCYCRYEQRAIVFVALSSWALPWVADTKGKDEMTMKHVISLVIN